MNMRRFTFLQSITILFLFCACVYAANIVAKYILREHGGYSQWSVFTDCSKTCGGGIRLRSRRCNKPVPRYGGRNCSVLGPPTQVFACNRQPCPVNGGYGPWGEYSPCTHSCGGGAQIRKRDCNNPSPQHGGKNCVEMELGQYQESRWCNTQKCPVNGGYSEWSSFSNCSVSCGGGVQSRFRTCDNPPPGEGGKDCTLLGPDRETQLCNNESCPTTPPTTEPTTMTTKRPTAELTTEPTTRAAETTSHNTTNAKKTAPMKTEEPSIIVTELIPNNDTDIIETTPKKTSTAKPTTKPKTKQS